MINDSDCCDGEATFWTGEPVPYEIYMKQTPWFVCQYHICYGFRAPESSGVCCAVEPDIDCDGWFQ